MSSLASLCRRNYSPACEEAINHQINMELTASYFYMGLASYFEKDTIALPGFHKFYQKCSNEEREHAMKLIEYQNKRGGRVEFTDIKFKSCDSLSAMTSLKSSLEEEFKVQDHLLKIYKIAEGTSDPQLTDFLDEMLKDQIDSQKTLADMITRLNRCGDNVGLYLFG